mgnify:CR=1 FL=1
MKRKNSSKIEGKIGRRINVSRGKANGKGTDNGLKAKNKRHSGLRNIIIRSKIGSRMDNARNLSDDDKKEIHKLVRAYNGVNVSGPQKHIKVADIIRIPEEKKNKDEKKENITSLQKRFKKKNLLRLYIKNESFRKVLEEGQYVFVDGYICQLCEECLDIIDGKFYIKKIDQESIIPYCVTIQTIFEKHEGNTNIIKKAKAPAKEGTKYDEKKLDAMKRFIMKDGHGGYLSYGELLSKYMLRLEYDNIHMEIITYISSNSIRRYRSNETKPSLPYAVAICIALELSYKESEEMIRLSEHVLDNATKLGSAYKFLLGFLDYGELTVQEANEMLIAAELDPLTIEKKL